MNAVIKEDAVGVDSQIQFEIIHVAPPEPVRRTERKWFLSGQWIALGAAGLMLAGGVVGYVAGTQTSRSPVQQQWARNVTSPGGPASYEWNGFHRQAPRDV